MGYEIKYEDIRNVRTTAISQITLWQQQLEEILESFQNLGNNMGMEGETAASIGYYVQDVHYTIIGNILQVLAEYLTRLAVYEEGFRAIDDAGDAHITQDVLEEKGTRLQSKREEFRELNESIQNVLNQIADICCITRPANGSIELGFYEVIGVAAIVVFRMSIRLEFITAPCKNKHKHYFSTIFLMRKRSILFSAIRQSLEIFNA